MFIKLTDSNGDDCYVKAEAVKALAMAEFPNTKTGLMVNDNPDGVLCVQEDIEEVLKKIEASGDLPDPQSRRKRPIPKAKIGKLPNYDVDFHPILLDKGFAIAVLNKGFLWRVNFGTAVGNYYPTTERWDINNRVRVGRGKEAFVTEMLVRGNNAR